MSKKVYCCYYIIPARNITHFPMKVFVCGVCKRELYRHSMDGVPKSMELVVEGCCGDMWQKW